jgi:hypothetical protein
VVDAVLALTVEVALEEAVELLVVDSLPEVEVVLDDPEPVAVDNVVEFPLLLLLLLLVTEVAVLFALLEVEVEVDEVVVVEDWAKTPPVVEVDEEEEAAEVAPPTDEDTELPLQVPEILMLS